MNQQPDELFRRKLEGYQRPAPASAWQKIEAAQRKKNNKALWLKLAASLVIPAVIGYGVWYNAQPHDKTIASTDTGRNATPEQTTTAAAPAAEVTTPDPTPVPETEAQPAAAAHGAPKKKARKATAAPRSTEKRRDTKEAAAGDAYTPAVAHVIAAEPMANEAANTTTTSQDLTTTNTAAAQPATTPSHGNTYTFSAADAEKYLDKKALAEATSSEKKSSTFKKLLQKAGDLKNNQDPVGELRQMKNEILALNFKNDKQRGQNK